MDQKNKTKANKQTAPPQKKQKTKTKKQKQKQKTQTIRSWTRRTEAFLEVRKIPNFPT